MRDRYGSAVSFRSALEQRLRAEAFDSGIPLNRLRKDAAFNRLLARLHKAAPDDWALKGGLALIGRLGAGVRATKDADANWRGTRSDLEEALATVEDSDLGDWFSFTIGDADQSAADRRSLSSSPGHLPPSIHRLAAAAGRTARGLGQAVGWIHCGLSLAMAHVGGCVWSASTVLGSSTRRIDPAGYRMGPRNLELGQRAGVI